MTADSPGEPSPEAWLAVLEAAAPRPLNLAEIARRSGQQNYNRREMRRMLDASVADGRLRRIGPTRYQWRADPAVERSARRTGPLRSGPFVEGRYVRVRGGFGFVAANGALGIRGDILVPRGREAAALHGDRVRIQVARRRGAKASGRVVEIVERANERVVGTIERRAGRRGEQWWLVPENEHLPMVELVDGTRRIDQDAGRLGVARILAFPTRDEPARGEIERILGEVDDPEVQVLWLAIEHGLRTEYPPDVLREAAALPLDPTPSELAGRADLRALPFVTIDGETARDFDDAVCLEALPGGGDRLRVAIADVSHYVPPGSALDQEAAARGTSVYFPDRAIPMLPERLSTELCSLRPECDRLVIVAEIELGPDGRPLCARFERAVIRSRARLTYTQVAAVLSEADAPQVQQWREELAGLLPQLRAMHTLMRRLYRRRIAAGSLDLDLPEALIDLSEEGRAVGVRSAPRNDAHRMIEEFMLVANRAVAEHLDAAEIPLPYRVHEPPDPQEIEGLNRYLAAFGTGVEQDPKGGGVLSPAALQRVLDGLLGHPLEAVLARCVLRALKQAHYASENLGHFGLAFPTYCHFTSPIRRYPDLVVHRQLGLLLDGRTEQARGRGALVAAASLRSSECERRAMEAERAMVDLKKAEFMLGHLLEPEPATVVSVARFGIFVELESFPVEGLVSIDALPGFWRYDEEGEMLTNVRACERIRLGDRFLVEAIDASLRRRQVAFAVLQRLPGRLGDSRGHGRRGGRPRGVRGNERRGAGTTRTPGAKGRRRS